MEAELRIQPMPVQAGGDDEEGALVLADGRLVAVLVRLAGQEHGELAGRWHLEAGFGPCALPEPQPVFGDLDTALAWVERRLAAQAQ